MQAMNMGNAILWLWNIVNGCKLRGNTIWNSYVVIDWLKRRHRLRVVAWSHYNDYEPTRTFRGSLIFAREAVNVI